VSVKVKIYRVEGQMLISHDKFPRIQRFVKDVRAVKPEDAIEIVYSELGSRHKLKRKHIKIFKVYEIPLEETKDVNLYRLSLIDKIVIV